MNWSSKKTSPSHYQLPDGFQVIDLTKHLGFCEGNIVKYCSRAGNKEGESKLDDLLKARYYLNLLIAEEKAKDVVEGTEITDPAGIRNWGKH